MIDALQVVLDIMGFTLTIVCTLSVQSRSFDLLCNFVKQTHAGVGLHWGRINIIELTTTVPRLPKLSDKDRFAGKKTKGICGKECLARFDRLSVMEIREIIDGPKHTLLARNLSA